MIPTAGHGPEQARRQRRQANAGLDLMLPDGSQMIGVRGLAGLSIGQLTVPPKAPGPSAQDLFGEAVGLWLDGALAAVTEALKITRRFLEDHAERLGAFADRRSLRTDLRELVKRLKSLKRWATEWGRRQLAERHALKLLNRAERAFEEFVENNPKPTDGTEKEWAKRRGRRLAAIEQRLAALKAAREAVAPAAETACEQHLSDALEAVEAWSSRLLKSYPLDSDSLPAAFGPVDGARLRAEVTMSPARMPRLH